MSESSAFIPAGNGKLQHLIFKLYLNAQIKKSFQEIKIIGKGIEEHSNALPMLYLGNHISWWDGFIPYYLNNKYLQQNFHLMMLESELIKRPFFRKLGAFGMDSTIIRQSLLHSAEILSHPRNMLVMFPQGKIHSQQLPNIKWQPGLQFILDKLTDTIQILFTAHFVDYFQHQKPTWYIYTKLLNTSTTQPDSWQSLYQEFYHDSQTKHSFLAQ
ncbi:MAG: lysophospholipid acyltransferase family protein [Bacteroidota bacterium]|nr:lysophospholipid acyltransferase family protein [Bacteroidota bacterium]